MLCSLWLIVDIDSYSLAYSSIKNCEMVVGLFVGFCFCCVVYVIFLICLTFIDKTMSRESGNFENSGNAVLLHVYCEMKKRATSIYLLSSTASRQLCINQYLYLSVFCFFLCRYIWMVEGKDKRKRGSVPQQLCGKIMNCVSCISSFHAQSGHV